MYYFLYGFLYLISLLPWRLLYFLSDCCYVLLYYIVGYRRQVVMNNLLIAFPDKTIAERTTIAKAFYKNLLDTFIETVKFLSISDKAYSKRISGNFEVLEKLYESGQNVHIHSGHFFNWEYMNWAVPRLTSSSCIGVYYPITNKAFNKIMLKMRQRYGSIMLSAIEFQTRFHELSRKRYVLGLYADQFPPRTHQAYWLKFFGRLTPFVTGPEKSARINNAAVVFLHHYKVKRGYYHADFTVITTTPKEYQRGELTTTYVRWLEACIRKKPFNYLWSHRRWKEAYKEDFKRNLLE